MLIIVYWGLYWGLLILGNYQVESVPDRPMGSGKFNYLLSFVLVDVLGSRDGVLLGGRGRINGMLCVKGSSTSENVSQTLHAGSQRFEIVLPPFGESSSHSSLSLLSY